MRLQRCALALVSLASFACSDTGESQGTGLGYNGLGATMEATTASGGASTAGGTTMVDTGTTPVGTAVAGAGAGTTAVGTGMATGVGTTPATTTPATTTDTTMVMGTAGAATTTVDMTGTTGQVVGSAGAAATTASAGAGTAMVGGMAGAGTATGMGGASSTGNPFGMGGTTSAAGAGAMDMGMAGAMMAAGGAATMPANGVEFFAQECAVCHGANGEGVDLLGPEIQHPSRDFATWVVRNGRTHPDFAGAMVPFGTDELSDAWLTEIFDFLDTPPQPTTGQALYMDYCANCHGADGAGGVTMRSLINEAQNVQNLVRSGHGGQTYSDRRQYMPVFGQDEISDAELNLIQQFVQGL